MRLRAVIDDEEYVMPPEVANGVAEWIVAYEHAHPDKLSVERVLAGEPVAKEIGEWVVSEGLSEHDLKVTTALVVFALMSGVQGGMSL